MDPFRSYIGKSVQWHGTRYEIECYEVHGRTLRFVAVSRPDGTRVFLSVLEMLESVIERELST